MSALQIESMEKEERNSVKSTSKSPPCCVAVRYIFTCTVAVVLTAGTPFTLLWDDWNAHRINYESLIELMAVYVVIVISFFALFRSDPGYLTRDIVAAMCQEDGLTLLGYEKEEGSKIDTVENGEMSSRESSLEPVSLRRSSSLQLMANGDNTEQDDDNAFDPLATSPFNSLFHGTRRKACEICELAPPLRSHHCKICNKCVATFDHHCGFLGTCIGERNHCRFWWFLLCNVAGSWLCLHIVGSSKYGFHTLLFHRTKNDETLYSSLYVVLAKLYLYPLMLVAVTLFVTHSVFAVLNLTTFECGKSRHIDYLRGTEVTDLPFSRGLLKNLQLFCCANDMRCFLGRQQAAHFTPILWMTPGKIIRDSEDWWENPWQNKYWSCC